MMIFKKVLIGFVGLVVVLLGIGFVLPRDAHVERNTTIDAPPDVVFAQVNDLRKWERWTPWGKDRDSTMEVTYGDPAAGKGAWYSWKSEELGTGRMDIVDSQNSKSIDADLLFEGQGDEPAKVRFVFEPTDGKTKVTWSFDADMGVWPPGRYFGLLMDKMLGPDYEKGLASLKAVAEKEAGTAK